ncbi:Zn(II)2Cys6 transcription factor [Aspergillus costaricaensis CBS 115574]|uniref:Zn(II)2Cys6 transcription factor n=1 Tax=Aspergillus costaricaensis CBS 115574 TaxID=1448317 RepID=A0ACD1IK16_9EURO|nr:Zn(II)2Cys6 transcription factor [Aspergillus costaricaensis CBS 115574]RAK90973.1 Zn(II)2Cys6 transcription factor [Aspergillus costaricaensis CBS 115574]
MLTAKRKPSSADLGDDRPVAKRSNSLSHNAHAPWLQDSRTSRSWRTLGDRGVRNSLPLENMVSTVRDLLDPDFDPLIALLDDEPRFLKPLPSRIPPEDLEFLRFREALSIPESGLRNELLRCYIKWVHSFMPVLNLQEFLRCVAENDPNGNISLLLFQAVMFVATAFIDLHHLQAAGYATRKIARNVFFTRLRLLYSLDCEDDRIVILQTLLLMTYWSDHQNNPQRDIWDWIGVCNIHAHSIGLNRDPSSSTDMDPITKRLRTRIWWSLYSRDRLIAMGLRRPTQVNEGTSNVPMLKLEDFDFEPFHPSVTEMFRCRQLEDVNHQKRLATMFIEKAKLCQCIGRVLFAQYTPSQCQFGVTTRTTISLIPRQASESELARCSQRLESWLSALPKDAQFIPASRTNFHDGEDVLLLHGAMVRMLYHATTSALHRPWAFTPNKDQSKARRELIQTAQIKMHDAAVGITHIIQGLNQLNLTRFLPQSGVTVIIPAAVAHLANSSSGNPATRESSIYNFQRCIQVLQGLRDIYPAADMEVANIEAAVKLQSDSANTFLRIMQYANNSGSIPQGQSPEQARKQSTISNPHTMASAEDRTSNHWTPPRDDPDPTNNHKQPGPHHSASPTKQQLQQQQQQRTPPKRHSSTINPPPMFNSNSSTTNTNHPTNPLSKQAEPTPPNDFDDDPISNFLNDNNNNNNNPTISPRRTHPQPNPTFDQPSDQFPFDFDLDLDSFAADFPPQTQPPTNLNPTSTTSHPDASPDLDIDWASELLRWTGPGPEDALTNNNDLFSPFAPTHNVVSTPGQRSLSHVTGDITGDLDRDLGFVPSDEEMF